MSRKAGRTDTARGARRTHSTALAFEGDRNEPSGRNPGEGVLARLRRADEERQLLLLVARGEVRVTTEHERRGAVVPGEHLVGDRNWLYGTAVT